MSRQRPRRFSYLDSEETTSYLSELLEGLPEGNSYSDRGGDSRTGGWSLGYKGSGINRGSGEESSFENTENLRHTPESLFKRLYRELSTEVEDEVMLRKVQSLSREGWEALKIGDIVEIAGVVKLPDEVKAIEMARGLEQARPILEAFSEDFNVDQREGELLSALGDLGESADAEDHTIVIVEVAASPRYRFVAKLKRDYLRTTQNDLEGEVTVLGVIKRKLGKDDPPIGLEQLIPGLDKFRNATPQMSRAERRSSKKKKQKTNDATSIEYPAATLIPIGIYH